MATRRFHVAKRRLSRHLFYISHQGLLVLHGMAP
jgi:hypothetical protein